MTLIVRRLKTDVGTFNNFVDILGAGSKPKHRPRSSHKFPAQRNRSNFRESLCRGKLKYASFRPTLHM